MQSRDCDLKPKKALAFTYLSFRFVPEITIILPLYVIYQRLNLYNTYIGLILVYQLIALPLMIWMMRSYFEEIPIAIEQAAQTEGYSWFGAFRKLVLPLVAPGMAATLVLAFIFCWNNFVFGLMLGGNSTQPVTVGLLSFIGTNAGAMGVDGSCHDGCHNAFIYPGAACPALHDPWLDIRRGQISRLIPIKDHLHGKSRIRERAQELRCTRRCGQRRQFYLQRW